MALFGKRRKTRAKGAASIVFPKKSTMLIVNDVSYPVTD